VIDKESPPGAWQTEWDRRFHTVIEYRQEICELRDRIADYLREIDALKAENEKLRESNERWVMEP